MDAREALPTLEYPDHPAKLKGPHKPVIVNGDLRRFLGRDVSTRPAIARYISRYVKARGLQVQVDQTKFRPDADLRAILGVEECTFLQIGKYISPHLTKIDLEDDADRLLQEFVSSVYGEGPLPNELSPGQRPSKQRQHSPSPAKMVKWCYGEDQIVTLRRKNGFFVDKTRFIVMTEDDDSPHLVLLRPSRSGKSLLTSQMQVYHDINTTQELFDEVFINRDGSPTDAYVQSSGGKAEGARAYCVLPLDFSIQVETGPGALPLGERFRDVLNGAMQVFMNKYQCCGFTEADVERGLMQVGLTGAQRIQTLRLMRKFCNGYKFHSESQPLYLAAYVIYFFKMLQRDKQRRVVILHERHESMDTEVEHYMKDDNVSLSHDVTSVLRSSSRAGVVALQDAFRVSKELTVRTRLFESPFTLAELTPKTNASRDVVRDPALDTYTDASTSLAYERALALLFYHGILSVRERKNNGALTVLNPPNLLACLDHFTQLEMALGSDIFFLERLIETPSSEDVTLLGFFDFMLQNKGGSSRVLLKLKVVRVNGVLYDDDEMTKAAERRGDFVDPKVDCYIYLLSYQEKLDLCLNPTYLYGRYRDCKKVGDLLKLALQQVGSYHRAVGQPVRSFVVVVVGTRALVA
eukprot:contig_16856_g4099